MVPSKLSIPPSHFCHLAGLSVLGPILFLIYINDLDDCNVLKFADDTKLFRKVNTDGDKQHLQNDLDRSEKWQMLCDSEYGSTDMFM